MMTIPTDGTLEGIKQSMDTAWKCIQEQRRYKKQLEAINSLEVIDNSVSALFTPENVRHLLDGGFIPEQIAAAIDEECDALELTTLAFCNTNADSWSHRRGFFAADVCSSSLLCCNEFDDLFANRNIMTLGSPGKSSKFHSMPMDEFRIELAPIHAEMVKSQFNGNPYIRMSYSGDYSALQASALQELQQYIESNPDTNIKSSVRFIQMQLCELDEKYESERAGNTLHIPDDFIPSNPDEELHIRYVPIEDFTNRMLPENARFRKVRRKEGRIYVQILY